MQNLFMTQIFELPVCRLSCATLPLDEQSLCPHRPFQVFGHRLELTLPDGFELTVSDAP